MYDHVRPDAIALMAATLMLKRAAMRARIISACHCQGLGERAQPGELLVQLAEEVADHFL